MVPVNWPYLKHKHLAPEEGHCVEVAITDVRFGAGCGWPVTQGWPRGPGLALMLPLRWRMDPADGERGEGPCGLQGLGWGSWREGLHLRKGLAIPCFLLSLPPHHLGSSETSLLHSSLLFLLPIFYFSNL